ncbi:hypothetical protein NDU88_008194, partial [Pleurodeles waltl]
ICSARAAFISERRTSAVSPELGTREGEGFPVPGQRRQRQHQPRMLTSLPAAPSCCPAVLMVLPGSCL